MSSEIPGTPVLFLLRGVVGTYGFRNGEHKRVHTTDLKVPKDDNDVEGHRRCYGGEYGLEENQGQYRVCYQLIPL